MKMQRLILWIVITAGVVAGATYIARRQAPETGIQVRALFPQLPQQVDRVARMELRDAEHHAVIERRGDGWVVANRDGYPARVGMVKSLVVNLSQLRVLAGKTRNPKLYSRLQVEGTPEKPGKSLLLTVSDGQGGTLASLVVGKRKKASALDTKSKLYVRLPGQPQSLLVEGQLKAQADPIAWMDKDLFDIRSERMRRVEIRHPDGGRVLLTRPEKGKRFRLADIPAGKTPKSAATVQSLATALEEFRLWDVRARDKSPLPSEPVVATFTTFDGLQAVVRTAYVKKDEKYYATFDFSRTPQADQAVGKELDKLGFVQRWVFEIPTYKGEMLTKRMSGLLRDESGPTPPGQ